MRFGHEGGPAFLPVDHEADAIGMAVKTVEYRQVTFTGHPENMGHPLFDEAFDQQVAGQTVWGQFSIHPCISLVRRPTPSAT